MGMTVPTSEVETERKGQFDKFVWILVGKS